MADLNRGAARPRIRITYVLPNVESGGTERHLLSLVRALDRSRFDLSLVTTAGGGSLLPEFSKVLRVRVFGDPARGRRFRTGPLEHLRTVARLAAIFRHERPDIVHAYLPAANVIGPIAARIAGVPKVVVSKRALADYKANYPLLRKIEPLGNRLADVVLVNSDAVRRDVERTERHWEGKIRKIYTGVAPAFSWPPEQVAAFRRREGIAEDAPVVLCVSNFYPYKGHRELVEAAASVAAAFPKVLFLLAGRDAGTLEETVRLVQQKEITQRVWFLGSRPDVADLVQASDVFVHPSREEGFSNAILEAMAGGLPVVAFDVGGNGEAIVHGVTGLLAPPRDAGALASAIMKLLADPIRAQEMGRSAKRRAEEEFSLERMVRDMERLYCELAGRA